jgi:hypothetical protein
MVLKAVGWDYVDLINLAEDTDTFLAFVNTVMNLCQLANDSAPFGIFC